MTARRDRQDSFGSRLAASIRNSGFSWSSERASPESFIQRSGVISG